VLYDTGVDLAEVSTALVDLDAAWATPLTKVKAPYDLVVSTLRAIDQQEIWPKSLMYSLRDLGQEVYHPRTPAGWSDRAEDWIVHDALIRRIEWAREVASGIPRTVDPVALAEVAIGPVASPTTLNTIAEAPSVEAGVALVFASAEFQRR